MAIVSARRLGGASLDDLKSLQAAVTEAIDSRRSKDKADLTAKLREMAGEYGFSLGELVASSRKRTKRTKREEAPAPKKAANGSSVPVKYRDPNTGETWSGRGRKARWLSAHIAEGRKLKEFRV